MKKIPPSKVHDFLRETESVRRREHEKERRMVARIMARPENADIYLDDCMEHVRCRSYWRSGLLYHMFMYMLELRWAGFDPSYARELLAFGKKIVKEEEAAGFYKTETTCSAVATSEDPS